MPNAGWYDDNMGRAYPLLTGATGIKQPGGGETPNPGLAKYLPNDVLVDFGSIMGPDAAYDDAADLVYLYAISRQGDEFTFEFRSTAARLATWHLQFCRSLTDPRFAVEHVDAAVIQIDDPDWVGLTEEQWLALTAEESAALALTEPVEGESEEWGCGSLPIWSGFLVTGDLTRLAATLPSDGQVLVGGTLQTVEPSLIRNLAGSAVNAVHLANKERTRVTAPVGCRPPCYDFTTEAVYVQATCLRNDLRFLAGYNAAITQNATDNSLQFAARQGSGKGTPCEEVPLFPGEAPPTGSSLLTGGPSCEETIRSINGVAARLFLLAGGAGTALTPSTTPHQLTIRVSGAVLVVDDSEASEESEDSEESEELEHEDCDPPADGDDPCDCGALTSEESE